MARRRGDLRLVLGAEPGGADDVDDAGLGGELGEGDGRRGNGEVEDAVGLGEGLDRLVGDRDAVRREAGEEAGILADLRRAGPFDRGGEGDAGGRVDDPHQRPPHLSGGADHHQPHVGHVLPRVCQPGGYSRARECGANRGRAEWPDY